MVNCPQCEHDGAKRVKYMGTLCLVCGECGYDERDELDVTPTEKTHKYKAVYKRGGHQR